jgi:carbonic anhydrase
MIKRLSFAAIALVGISASAEEILNFNTSTRSCVGHSDSTWGYYGQISRELNGQRQEILLPNDWGRQYAACGHSLAPMNRQSPIELPAATTLPVGGNESIEFAGDKEASMVIEHNCHTIQATLAEDSVRTMRISGQEYRLLQFHIHTPSEHVIGGDKAGTRNYPAELHFVHAGVRDDGSLDSDRLAVVGLFVDVTNQREPLPGTERFFGNMLKDYRGVATRPGEPITANIEDIIEGSSHYWRYQGSLTTPPCSETVEWLVVARPLVVSTATYRSLQAAKLDVGFANNRPPLMPTAYHNLRYAKK